jgi:hypothetical protein
MKTTTIVLIVLALALAWYLWQHRTTTTPKDKGEDGR